LPERLHKQRQFRDDDRDGVVSARQAAEALFTPKPAVAEESVSDPAQLARSRTPRVLPVLPATAIRRPGTLEEPTAPQISAQKLARVRTLVRYGMTVSQVADLYRVPVETIERILHKA
jgi:hypothetical protein